ncbi:MAG: SDR family oxidoreductase [Planctomycetes bacterium]|nr:SDR family oxidoreductase [Planctomycetota bacterium]
MSDFLGLAGKTILVTGVANKKSVAHFVSRALVEAGANVLHAVRSAEVRDEQKKLVGDAFVCDVERQDEIDALARTLTERGVVLDGLVHSIAFANYREGVHAFHDAAREDFLRAVDVSCFSLVALAKALESRFARDASVVALSISTTTMAAESYGYMAPIKAALDSTVVFLAKSFAATGELRFNAVKAGPLKTSASAGIPGYLDNYLFAEAATLRHRALTTEEVASSVVFLLSPRSSGINAQGLVVDAGMGTNFFDREIVRRFHRGEERAP